MTKADFTLVEAQFKPVSPLFKLAAASVQSLTSTAGETDALIDLPCGVCVPDIKDNDFLVVLIE